MSTTTYYLEPDPPKPPNWEDVLLYIVGLLILAGVWFALTSQQ